MAYAYADKYGTVHIVEKMDVALKNHAKGNVVETDYPHRNGYPTMKGKSIFLYPYDGKAYIGGNGPETGKEYNITDDYALTEIVNKIRE